MIRRVWVRNFRMLANNRVDLGGFAVLVGRNASGKSTLMSALRFVSAFLAEGLEKAVELALDGSEAGFRVCRIRPSASAACSSTPTSPSRRRLRRKGHNPSGAIKNFANMYQP